MLAEVLYGGLHDLTYLIGTGDNPRKLVFLFFLSFHHSLQDGWMVGSQIDKDMADAALGVKRSELVFQLMNACGGIQAARAHTSQRASKNAKDAV